MTTLFPGFSPNINIEQFTHQWSDVMELPLLSRRVTKGGKNEDLPILGTKDSHKFNPQRHKDNEKVETVIYVQCRALTAKEQ